MLQHTDTLFQALDAVRPVEPVLKHHFKKIFSQRQFARNHFLAKPGRTTGFAWFVAKGSVRAFLIDEIKGVEVTTWFWLEGDFVWALDSFCRRLPTRYYIQLLEDSVLQVVSRQDLDATGALFPQYRLLERAVTEACHARYHQHYHFRVSRPARERYERLMQGQPQLFHKAAVKDIASFLGMFPDTLSRLRSQR